MQSDGDFFLEGIIGVWGGGVGVGKTKSEKSEKKEKKRKKKENLEFGKKKMN